MPRFEKQQARDVTNMKLKSILLSALIVVTVGAAAQSQLTPSAPPPPKAPRLLSAVFMVSNIDRSLTFYTKGLGLTAPMRMNHPGAFEVPLLFPGGGAYLLLVQHKKPPASGLALPHCRIAIDAPDLRAVASRLEAAGYRLSAPIAEHPGEQHVLLARVKDPDGNELELVQRPR